MVRIVDVPDRPRERWEAVEGRVKPFAVVCPAGGPAQSIGSQWRAANSPLIRPRGFPDWKKYRGVDGCPLFTKRRFSRGTPRRIPSASIRPRRFLASPPNNTKTIALLCASFTNAETMARVTGRHSARCHFRCSSTARHVVPPRCLSVLNALMVGVRLIQRTPCPVRYSNMDRGGGSMTDPFCNPRRSLPRRPRRSPRSNPRLLAPGHSAAAAQSRFSKLGVTRPASSRSSFQSIRSPCSKERPVARRGSGYGSLPITTTFASDGLTPSSA